jgi:hypothetical protein
MHRPRKPTPFRWVCDRAEIDPGLTEHVKERLGLAPSLFHAWVEEMFPKTAISRAVLIARAYDNYFGTAISDLSDFITVDLPDLEWDSYIGAPTSEDDFRRACAHGAKPGGSLIYTVVKGG